MRPIKKPHAASANDAISLRESVSADILRPAPSRFILTLSAALNPLTLPVNGKDYNAGNSGNLSIRVKLYWKVSTKTNAAVKPPKERKLTESEKSEESRNTAILKLDCGHFNIYARDV
jgi:hypothetical protein